MSEILLKVENLHTRFGKLKAVRGVSFSVASGEVLGVVGESGSGKSVTALSLLRLIEPPGEISEGRVIFRDGDGEETDLLKLSEKQLEKILGNKISMVFQDPMTSLNPVLSIGYQIAESLRVHRGFSKSQAREKTIDLLQKVGIRSAAERFKDYPHEFSGGMRQRVMIAMAIACEPKLLVADEPTTALDVSVQAQILRLLRAFKAESEMSVIIITHDLGVIAEIADRVAVMYAGKIVENAPLEAIFNAPQHPYTRALVASIPKLGVQPERLPTIEGAPPRIQNDEPAGCSFYLRCPLRQTICAEIVPDLFELETEHSVACHIAQKGASANA